jgi:hypothetical protein
VDYRTEREIVLPGFPSPERGSFEPALRRASCNILKLRGSHIRTKMGVVRLCQREGRERARKRPEIGLPAAPRGSDDCPQRPAFCAVAAARSTPKKNAPTGETGGRKGIRTRGSKGGTAAPMTFIYRSVT